MIKIASLMLKVFTHGTLFLLLWVNTFINFYAQSSKYVIQNYKEISTKKQLSEYTDHKDGSKHLVVNELVVVIKTYVIKDSSFVFFVDTVQDSYMNLNYTNGKSYSVPLTQFLIGNNKVQFYGYHTQLKILYSLNNDSYVKINFTPADTVVKMLNKKTGTFLQKRGELEGVQKKQLFIPPFSFGIPHVYPTTIKSPIRTIQFEKQFYLNSLPFKEEIQTIRNKLIEIEKDLDKVQIKESNFKDYFIPKKEDLFNPTR